MRTSAIRNRTLSIATQRVLALLAASSLALPLSACQREDATQAAIREAGIQFEGLGAVGSTALPSVARRKGVYESIIRSLKDATSGGEAAGTGGQSSAANTMLARAHAGLGDILSAEAVEAEREALSTASAVRGSLDQALSQFSVASGLEIYDPEKDIAALDALAQMKAEELESVKARHAEQVGVVERLLSEATTAEAGARSQRDQEASARLASQQGSQTLRLTALEQATQYRRLADKQERTASELRAEAASEQPKAEEIQAEIARLTRQIELIGENKASLRARAENAKAQAQSARSDAARAAAMISARLEELAKNREATTAPTEASLRAYAAAASAAKKAAQNAGPDSRETVAAAKLSYASYLSSIAAIKSARTRGLRSYAELLRSVEGAKIEGLNAGSLKTAPAEEAAKASLEETRQAFEEAISAFGAVGGSAEAQAKIDAIKQRLMNLIGQKPEPAPGTEGAPGEPEPSPPPAPDAPTGDGK